SSSSSRWSCRFFSWALSGAGEGPSSGHSDDYRRTSHGAEGRGAAPAEEPPGPGELAGDRHLGGVLPVDCGPAVLRDRDGAEVGGPDRHRHRLQPPVALALVEFQN